MDLVFWVKASEYDASFFVFFVWFEDIFEVLMGGFDEDWGRGCCYFEGLRLDGGVIFFVVVRGFGFYVSCDLFCDHLVATESASGIFGVA